MKRESFTQDRRNDFRQGFRVENGTTTKLFMKRESFRASRGRGLRGETEFRLGIRVENDTTNHLLSLMI